MKLRTEIEKTAGLQGVIDHSQPVVMLGSCFTDNIGSRLVESGFQVDINPAGTIFNPLTIENTVGRLARRVEFSTADLVQDANGVWHSFDLHSRFSSTAPELVVIRANERFAAAADFYRRARVAIVTLGTAWIFEHDSGAVVANCHKFPAADFTRVRLTVETVVRSLESTVAMLRAMSPGIKVIFTVSPVRHTADGLHGNQLSKSTLLLALDMVAMRDGDVIYYPAYEIMNDDLRDYRFYADDLKHPSNMAIDYIYQHFQDTFFTAATRETARESTRRARRASHRPIVDGNSQSAR